MQFARVNSVQYDVESTLPLVIATSVSRGHFEATNTPARDKVR